MLLVRIFWDGPHHHLLLFYHQILCAIILVKGQISPHLVCSTLRSHGRSNRIMTINRKVYEHHVNFTCLNISLVNLGFSFFGKSVAERALKVSEFYYGNRSRSSQEGYVLLF